MHESTGSGADQEIQKHISYLKQNTNVDKSQVHTIKLSGIKDLLFFGREANRFLIWKFKAFTDVTNLDF